MKFKFFILILFCSFLIFTSETTAEDLSAIVTRVSDGDTIWVQPDTGGKKIKIRIWGIDTPEKFKSRKLYQSARVCRTIPGKVKHLGERASGFAKRILKGKKVRVEVMGRGKYGRVLAKIILPDGEDYGLKIIKEGYSCVYWKTTDEAYIKAMKEADKTRKGLWGLDYRLMKCLCY